jgi:hypothetical protein
MAQSGMEGGMTEGYERLDELLSGAATDTSSTGQRKAGKVTA